MVATTKGRFLSRRGPRFFWGEAKKKKGLSGCPSSETKTRASETPARGSTAPLRSNSIAVAKFVVSAPWQLAGCFTRDSRVKQPSLGDASAGQA